MDADLIRLILLVLGACLVVGIWLWDRWQRTRGEPPMVRLREQDVADEAEDRDEHAEPPVVVEPVDQTEPAEPVFVASRDEPVEIGEPLSALDVDESAPAPDAEPRIDAVSVAHKPAWVEPREPVIPAFLVASDAELEAEQAPQQAAPEAVVESEPEPERHRMAPQAAAPSLVLDTDDEPEIPVLELAPEPIDTPARAARAKTKEPAPKPKAKTEAEPVSIRMDEDQFDLDLGFSAVDDQDLQEVAVDLPDLIVQINIVAKGGQFSGEQVLAAMDQVEMRAGEHDIFHRYDNRAARGQKPKALFSLANLVEPGNFPLKKMKDFSTPGLTLFTQLPGPRDGLLIYSDMLYVAERLARLLDARLKDENRSTLTKQTIEHTRERIAEHKRQITLKLRQAGDSQRGRR